MSDPESAILAALSASPAASIPDTYTFSSTHKLDHNQVVGVSKSLEGDAYVKLTELSTSFFVLGKEAESIVNDGSQEILVLAALIEAGDGGLSMPELQGAVGKDVCKIGMGNCLKNKWAKKEKDGKLVAVVKIEDVRDEVRELLQQLKEGGGDPKSLDDKVRCIFDDTAVRFVSSFIFSDNATVIKNPGRDCSKTPQTHLSRHPQIVLNRSRTILFIYSCQKSSWFD